MAIDLSRETTGVVLNPEESEVIIAKTLEESTVMKLARRIALPGRGLSFQTITGEPEAAWVDETDPKPNDVHTLGTKTMRGYTLAVIEPMSNQFRRDKAALVAELIRRLPKALSKKFDETVLKGKSGDEPGSDFDLMDAITKDADIETNGNYHGLVDAEELINEDNYLVNGYAMSPKARAGLLKAVDNNNRPLFLMDLKDGDTSKVLGQPTYFSNAVGRPASATDHLPEQYGFAADWSKAMYGVVEDVKVDITDKATITVGGDLISLWERNMFAIRAEIEVGFIIGDTDAFVRLVGATPTASAAKKAEKKEDK